ncbi:MAG: hypothetical protein ACE5EF_09450 [Dehalococcoidia bacterium]
MKLKVLAITGALIVSVVGTTAVALAGWCWGDPVVGITAPGQAERYISIDVAVPNGFVRAVDKVPIKVRVPENVSARVKFQDNYLPEVVEIKRDLDKWREGDAIDVKVSVEVKSDKHFSDKHFSDEHFSDEHFSDEHFSDEHFSDEHFSDEHFPVAWKVTWTDPDGTERIVTRSDRSDHRASVSFKLRDH